MQSFLPLIIISSITNSLLISAISDCYKSPAVRLISVIIGDGVVYGYSAQSPALDIGFARAINRYPDVLRNVNRVTIYRPGNFSCAEAAAIMPIVASEAESSLLEKDKGFNVILSSGCSLEAKSLGDFAREWDVPLLATIATDPSLADARRFPTIVAFTPADAANLLRATLLVLERFSWRTMTFLCDDLVPVPYDNSFTITMCRFFAGSFDQQQASLRLNVNILRFDGRISKNSTQIYAEALQRASMQSRVRQIVQIAYPKTLFLPFLHEHSVVWIFATNSRVLRDIMVTAHRLGMTSGDYVFITPRPPKTPTIGAMKWQLFDSDDQAAFSGFECLITLSNRGPNWRNIAPLLTEIANRTALSYNRTLTEDENRNDLSVVAYETMTSLTEVLALSIQQQDLTSATRGRDFRRLFFNKTFVLPSRTVFLGADGMRINDVVFSKFNSSSGLMETAWQYKSLSREFEETSALAGLWKGSNGPPRDTPFCGFTGDRCVGQLERTFVISLASGVTMGLVCAIYMTFAFYHWISGRHTLWIWWVVNSDQLFLYRTAAVSIRTQPSYNTRLLV